MAEAEVEFRSHRNTKDHWRKEIDLSEKISRGITTHGEKFHAEAKDGKLNARTIYRRAKYH